MKTNACSKCGANLPLFRDVENMAVCESCRMTIDTIPLTFNPAKKLAANLCTFSVINNPILGKSVRVESKGGAFTSFEIALDELKEIVSKTL